MTHPACLPPEELLADCTVERTRRSGPGGQHRNKVETAVVLRHQPTGVRAEASERRSQLANLAKATFRLRLALAIAERSQPAAAPSSLWLRRTLGGRIAVNPSHADFPALLAESLDMLASTDWSPAAAGSRLNVSSSQLVKLLRRAPAALMLVNEERRKLGLPACR